MLSIIEADTGGWVGHRRTRRPGGRPLVVALGLQLHQGRLGKSRGVFADPTFDRARQTANEVMDHLRRHGPSEPHRRPLEDPEYTTMHDSGARLADRWRPIPPPRSREPSPASSA